MSLRHRMDQILHKFFPDTLDLLRRRINHHNKTQGERYVPFATVLTSLNEWDQTQK